MIGYVGLGSNLGDRRRALADGVGGLAAAEIRPLALSSIWESEPIDAPPGSGWFLNMVARVDTGLAAERLLDALHSIERAAGRTANAPRNAPRTLDLDLLLLGEIRREASAPQLPHPRMWQRRFVLEPLAELAPALRRPEDGSTVAGALARVRHRERLYFVGRLARAESGPL